jgi:FemAB-related protein (PEP-CTERM system-associated)
MECRVEMLSERNESDWDAYVFGNPQASPFHLIAWRKALESSFPFRARYLLAFDSGRVRGVLPLFHVEGWLTGTVLLSTPFAVYGGILADTPEIRDLLGARLRHIAETGRVQYVELRNAYPEQRLGWAAIDRYVTFTQAVSPMTDDELLATVHKKTRNMVRKALKNSYSTRTVRTLDHFYRLLTVSYRRLGTPVFPRRFFEAIARQFGELVDIREVLLEGKVAAAALNFLFQGSMHTYYAASDPDLLPFAPNNYMYFDFLRWAGSNGHHTFDFGRSKKDTGTFEFKRHWGTTMRELPYELLLVERKDPPDFSPKNPRFDLAIRIWRNLPLPLTNFLGPKVIHLFP